MEPTGGEPAAGSVDRPLESAGTRRAGSGRRIVLVEDDDDFRAVLAGGLQGAGFAVTDIDNGEAALDYFRQRGGADLALFDWSLPGFSGLELLRRVKAVGTEIPTIFLTVAGEQIHEETAFLNGAVDFVDKTRSISILLNRIGAVMAGRKGPSAADDSGSPQATVRRGDLELCLNSGQVRWKARPVNLTLAEFRLVHHLATQADCHLGAEEIHAVLGGGSATGDRATPCGADLRHMVGRIRRKFAAVDATFDRLAAHPQAGFWWRAGSRRKPG